MNRTTYNERGASMCMQQKDASILQYNGTSVVFSFIGGWSDTSNSRSVEDPEFISLFFERPRPRQMYAKADRLAEGGCQRGSFRWGAMILIDFIRIKHESTLQTIDSS